MAATSSLLAGGPRQPPTRHGLNQRSPSMPKATRVNWQPISRMPLIAGMIKGSLDDTREHLGTLTKARDRPHVLDDTTIDRVRSELAADQPDAADSRHDQGLAG